MKRPFILNAYERVEEKHNTEKPPIQAPASEPFAVYRTLIPKGPEEYTRVLTIEVLQSIDPELLYEKTNRVYPVRHCWYGAHPNGFYIEFKEPHQWGHILDSMKVIMRELMAGA